MLEVAKEMYPKADDVVNVVIDGRGKKGNYDYIILSGIAIDYVEVK